jgi:hypothetical protein
MRFLLAIQLALAALLVSGLIHAGDPVAECEAFFSKLQKCVDDLKGEQQEEARIFLKTLRGTVGMSDGMNRGDPAMTGIMCGVMMEEAKKDPDIKKYNCKW